MTTHGKFLTIGVNMEDLFKTTDIGKFLPGKTLRSLSICEVDDDQKALITVGYTDEETTKNYMLESFCIGASNLDPASVSQQIELVVNIHNGVICQDLSEMKKELWLTVLREMK